jgi:hypothetical protein
LIEARKWSRIADLLLTIWTPTFVCGIRPAATQSKQRRSVISKPSCRMYSAIFLAPCKISFSIVVVNVRVLLQKLAARDSMTTILTARTENQVQVFRHIFVVVCSDVAHLRSSLHRYDVGRTTSSIRQRLRPLPHTWQARSGSGHHIGLALIEFTESSIVHIFFEDQIP